MTILSISSHIAYGFKIYDLSIDRLKDAIKSEMNITPCQFEGGHKTKEKWICAGDCLVFDFDIGVILEVMKLSLRDYTYLIHTTKSHRKLKNGIMSDRFRLYLFCKKITLNKSDYETLMHSLCELMKSDIQAAGCQMSFKGFKRAQFKYNEGLLFDWEYYFKKRCLNIQKSEPKKTPTHSNSKKAFMNQDYWPRMFKPDQIGEGERNGTMARYALWCRDQGLDRYEAESVLEWINNHMARPLAQKEVTAIIKGKFK